MQFQTFNPKNEEFFGIYASQLHLNDFHQFSIFHHDIFLIKWFSNKDKKEHYWQINCSEVEDLHQFSIESQSLPHPFSYELLSDFDNQQHAIHTSSYNQQEKSIKNVFFLGFHLKNEEVITQIILQFEQFHLKLVTGPVVHCTRHAHTFENDSLQSPLKLLYKI